jgi:hypothetical protein
MINALPNGDHPHYRIVNLKSAKVALKALLARAAAMGVREALVNAIKANWARLASDPMDFGESCYDLANLQLHVRLAGWRSLGLRFAVDPRNRIVYVIDVYPLAGLGLQ